ncbi:MAG TPA: cytochrome c, partial [Polyangiaceae bacterium]
MHKKWWAAFAIVAVLGGLGGWAFWYNIYRTEPDPNANLSVDQHFLYGSIGTEGEEGIPYWVFLVLPKVFPEYLPGPGGYAALGLAWEPTHDLPAGLTHRTVGFERVGVNCAFCHVAAVRLTEDQPVPTFYPGAPGHQVHVQDYQRFLFQAASDPRFNSDVLLDAIGAITTLSAREKFLYRYLLIPQTRSALIQNKKDFTWAESRPLYGPGRLDPFDPVRFRFFKEKDDGSIGTVDIPPVWNQKPRVGMSLHWDGLTKKVHESAMTAAIGDGARQTYLDLPSLEKDEEYLLSTSPAKFPLPINQALAEQGSHLFAANCASCHSFGGART